jgi:molybdopterin-guanine dinucleotide biosynthesis protein A
VAALREQGCRRVLALAVDAPTICVDDVLPLLQAPSPGAAFANLHLPLLLWSDAFPPGGCAGWSMARLIGAMRLTLIEPAPAAILRLRGANTPAERAQRLEEFAARGRGSGCPGP